MGPFGSLLRSERLEVLSAAAKAPNHRPSAPWAQAAMVPSRTSLRPPQCRRGHRRRCRKWDWPDGLQWDVLVSVISTCRARLLSRSDSAKPNGDTDHDNRYRNIDHHRNEMYPSYRYCNTTPRSPRPQQRPAVANVPYTLVELNLSAEVEGQQQQRLNRCQQYPTCPRRGRASRRLHPTPLMILPPPVGAFCGGHQPGGVQGGSPRATPRHRPDLHVAFPDNWQLILQQHLHQQRI